MTFQLCETINIHILWLTGYYIFIQHRHKLCVVFEAFLRVENRKKDIVLENNSFGERVFGTICYIKHLIIWGYFSRKPMFPLFLHLPEKKCPRSKWAIFKHESDKNKKCLQVILELCLSSSVARLQPTPAYIEA